MPKSLHVCALALNSVSDVATLPLRLDTKSRDVAKLGRPTSVCISLQLESSDVHKVTQCLGRLVAVHLKRLSLNC